jgi:hypothetical protein
MNQDNRVLGRRGARELTPRETEYITGAIQTQTVCTNLGVQGGNDGDTFEC